MLDFQDGTLIEGRDDSWQLSISIQKDMGGSIANYNYSHNYRVRCGLKVIKNL